MLSSMDSSIKKVFSVLLTLCSIINVSGLINYSWSDLCEKGQCFDAINNDCDVSTTPTEGTCGYTGNQLGEHHMVWDDVKQDWITCKRSCPRQQLTYPTYRNLSLKEFGVLQEIEFWSESCTNAGTSVSNNYGDYNDYAGAIAMEADPDSKRCFENDKNVHDYARTTHSFWIMPLKHIRKGTLISFSKYPRPSILLVNNYIAIHTDTRYSNSYNENSSYIPDNQWTHIGLQMNTTSFPNMELFVNGSYISTLGSFISTPARKKRAAYFGKYRSTQISLGISSNLFRNYEGFQTYPLEIQQCIDIGYSAAVTLHCSPRSGSFKMPQTGPGLANCSLQQLTSQSSLASTIFNDEHDWSVYKCNYDHNIVTLFTCGYYLPAFSYQLRYSGMIPCRSLCEEFFDSCGDDVRNVPGLNKSCSFYPEQNCITRDFLPDVGIYKGIIKNYTIYNDTLSNREMKLLGDMDTKELPNIEPLSNCLCPHNYPAVYEANSLQCVTNQYKANNPETDPVNFYNRLSDEQYTVYHFKEYVLDHKKASDWISKEALEVVSLDISFNDAVQVLGVEFVTKTLPPMYTSPGTFPLELYLLDMTNQWKKIAVLTNDSSTCSNIDISKPGGIQCFVYSDVVTTNQTTFTYKIDILQNHSNHYNFTHMDLELVQFLQAKGVRLQFNGFSKDKIKFPERKYLYHRVSDVSVHARYYSGTTLCGCYADGTDLSLTCDPRTGQCPCKPGHRQHAGKKCLPYVLTANPSYGPKSGGTKIEIIGGFFGIHKPTVQIMIGNELVDLKILNYSDTSINVLSAFLNTHSQQGVLGEPMKVLLTLSNGHKVPLTFTFTYMEDPIIKSITPLTTFLQGGIQQTVIGEYLTSVYRPYLKVTFVDHWMSIPPIHTICTIINDTVMMCPSPDLTSLQALNLGKSDMSISANIREDNIQKGERRKRDTHISKREADNVERRFKVNSQNWNFYVGFQMDGVQTYQNVTEALGEQYGKMSVFVNPEFEKFEPEIRVFKPYKGDEFLFIKGQKMNLGCGLKDYMISVGDKVCEPSDLTSNELICKAPPSPPEANDLRMKEGAHSLKCEVGNIKVNIGYVKYCMSPLCEGPVVAGIVMVCIVMIIVILLLVLFLLHKFGIVNLRHILSVNPNIETGVKYHEKNEQVSLVGKPPEKPCLLDMLQEYDQDLYGTVVNCKVDCSKMSLGKQIGEGNFGSVNRGQYLYENFNIDVAIKSMKSNTEDIEKVAEFLEEGTIMAEFKHENVLTMYGVVFEHDVPYIMLPYMENGDLKSYLSCQTNKFTFGELIDFGSQIAKGMSYLCSLKFVHRDLAARNCMVNKDQVVKIADFGLSRDIYEKDYYAVEHHDRPMPVKWMAIECLETFKFTSKSDAWSYGVTLWEVVMRGAVPFSNVQNIHIKQHISMGNRLDKPYYCPDEVYHVMSDCWKSDPNKRPSFDEIVHTLDTFVQELKSDKEKTLENKTNQKEEVNSSKQNISLESTKLYHTYIELTAGEEAKNNNNRVEENGTDHPTTKAPDGYLKPVVTMLNDDYLEAVAHEKNKMETVTVPQSDDYLKPVQQHDDYLVPAKHDNGDYLEPVKQNNDDYLAPGSCSNNTTNSSNICDSASNAVLTNQNDELAEKEDNEGLEGSPDFQCNEGPTKLHNEDNGVRISSIFMHDTTSEPHFNYNPTHNSESNFSPDRCSHSGSMSDTGNNDKHLDIMKPVNTVCVDLQMDNSYSKT